MNMGHHNCQTTFVGGINPFLPAGVEAPDVGANPGLHPKSRIVERDVLAALASHGPESTYGLAKRLNLPRYTCRSALNRLANRPTPLVAVVHVQPSPNNSKPTYFYGLVS